MQRTIRVAGVIATVGIAALGGHIGHWTRWHGAMVAAAATSATVASLVVVASQLAGITRHLEDGEDREMILDRLDQIERRQRTIYRSTAYAAGFTDARHGREPDADYVPLRVVR